MTSGISQIVGEIRAGKEIRSDQLLARLFDIEESVSREVRYAKENAAGAETKKAEAEGRYRELHIHAENKTFLIWVLSIINIGLVATVVYLAVRH